LVNKAKMSDEDKKHYRLLIRFIEERMLKGLRNDPEAMKKLLDSYEKKKEIIKNEDKDAWKKLMEEEEKELEALVNEEK